jgi:high-affinity K+ transport system ATPase subunit B
MATRIVSGLKIHILIALVMFFFIVYSAMQSEWKARVLLLIPITVLFAVFVAAYAYEMRDLSAEAVRLCREKEERNALHKA